MKMVAIGVMLAILFSAAAAAEQEPLKSWETCIAKTKEVPGANTCICSKNCACAGKCIIEGGDAQTIKTCFVECVLMNDCNCKMIEAQR